MPERATEYYNQTAQQYDQLHGGQQNLEHIRALETAWPILDRLDVGSAIDVGCGTGRSLEWLESHKSSMRLFGVDPSESLLAIARNRVPQAKMELGRGEELAFEDNSVDLALATGIMHHVDRPRDVIDEMFRVATKVVLISDHNNFAFGGPSARRLRLWLYSAGLLELATFVKQGFRRQGYSKDDGWWYPYSLLNDYGTIARHCSEMYLVPTRPSSLETGNLLLSQSHLAIIAMKSRPGA